MAPSLLVFGLSGQIGEPLLRRALPWTIEAVSRQPRPDRAGIRWRLGDLQSWRTQRPVFAVLSLGPLDQFARAVADDRIEAGRIVAFGSTSVRSKAASRSPAERAIAERLARAEEELGSACARRGSTLFILRPTMIWGTGRDATVSRVAAMARHWPLLPLPVAAPGLRQPVHVADLAAAAVAALQAPASHAGTYDLPGGEELSFGALLTRTAFAAAPDCRILPVPWRSTMVVLRCWPKWHGTALRLGSDLIFDPAPARAALGFTARGYAPVGSDFPQLSDA